MKIKRLLTILLTMIILSGIFTVNGFTVDAAAKKKQLNITDISLNVGQSRKLKVSGGKSVKWSTSAKKIVTVTKNGKIKAKKKGKAIITAKVSGKKLKCNVVVNKPSKKNKDILITYFSQSGTTKSVANKIQKLTGGDLLRIKEKNKYTDDYEKLAEQAKGELDNKRTVKSTTEAKNIRSYDVIYIGYPIWWHSTPRIINTFLEKYSFKGKTVIPFCTSGGSDISESIEAFKASCKGAEFKDGYTADEGTKSEIKKWLKNIDEL